jgi:hypothetical protein
MAKFEVRLDESGDPISSTVAALSGRKLPILEGDFKVLQYA